MLDNENNVDFKGGELGMNLSSSFWVVEIQVSLKVHVGMHILNRLEIVVEHACFRRNNLATNKNAPKNKNNLPE